MAVSAQTVERRVEKSAQAFRTISEVATELDVPQHVLRFWESKFSQVRPLKRGGGRRYYRPEDIDLVSTHATSTPSGDVIEARVVREVFGDGPKTHVNNTKSFIGHAMGAAGALELLGNVPSFGDNTAHATINLDQMDERCGLKQVVANTPRKLERVEHILNNSFGMLGINSVLIVKKFPQAHGGVYA